MLAIDINCDMGESTHLWPWNIDKDLSLLPFISSMNLACGFHAGDPHTMHTLAEAALAAGVAVGAHPSFDDKDNFGRSNLSLSPEKVYDIVLYQVGALQAFLKVHGAALHHVKPHGALYNMAAVDPVLATAIVQAVKDLDAGLLLYGLAGSELIHAAWAVGLPTVSEVFADRTYTDAGTLTPRSLAGALIESETDSIAQVLQMAMHGSVQSTSGKTISLQVETICIHSDGAHALAFAQNMHHALLQQGIVIKHG
jgi:UPF0271 protein